MQEISGGSAGDSIIEDHEGRCLGLKGIHSTQRKTKETENVMQPFNLFLLLRVLIEARSSIIQQIFIFSRYEVAVLLTCKHLKLAFLKSPSVYVFIYHRYIKGLSYKYQKRALKEFATFLQPR